MRIELSRDEAEAVRTLLQERLLRLDKEINRTDAFKYKARLQKLDRTIERVLGELKVALDHDHVAM
jgi:division protein CdvB (Snf7/Vps24/ESCRT-III family)